MATVTREEDDIAREALMIFIFHSDLILRSNKYIAIYTYWWDGGMDLL